jgi:hypothetical protein
MRSIRPLAFALLLAFLLAVQPAAATRISGPLPAFGDVVSYQITPDGSRVIYLADPQVSNKYELFSVPADGSAPPVRLHDELLPDRDLIWHTLTPDGAQVVFAIEREIGQRFERTLFSVPSDGSAPAVALRLPTGFNDEMNSVSGFRVTNDVLIVEFVNRVEEAWELFRSDLSGAAPAQRLIRIPFSPGVYAWIVGLTPDYRRLVYAERDYTNAQFRLFSVTIDGSAPPVRLSVDETLSYFSLVGFSADGRQVLLDGGGPGVARQLLRVSLDGTPAQILTGVGEEALQIDGSIRIIADTWALFACWRGELTRIGICVAPLDGSGSAVQLTDEYAISLDTVQLTPDGTRLIANGGAINDFFFQPAIISIPLDGSGAVTTLFVNAYPTAYYVNYELVGVAPAGVVVFQYGTAESMLRFAVIPLAGGTPRFITPPLAFAYDWYYQGVTLTDDGSRLLFVAAPVGDEAVSLYSAPLNGTPTAPVNLSAGTTLTRNSRQYVVRDGRVILVGVDPERGMDELFSLPIAPPGLGFDQFTAYATEGIASPLQVTLTPAATVPVSAEYALLNGDDEVVVSGTLSLEPGATSTVLSLTVPDDKTPRPDQTFTLQLTNLSGAAPRISSRIEVEVRDADAFRLALPVVSNQLYDFLAAP